MMITISIVTYNHKYTDIRPTLDSIFLITKLDFRVYIIDNSPTDKLKYELKSDLVEYISNPANTGYGAGHNIAIKAAIENSVEYHLVLNPDVYFGAGVLETIIEYMYENNNIGNIMPKVFYPDNSIQYLCKLLPTPYDWIGRRFNPFKRLVDKRNKIFELQFTNYNEIMDVPYLSGCFMFLRLDALKKVGLFDENIFMYGEETDLCRRFIAGGYKTVFYPEVSIIHEFQKGSHKSWRLTWIGIKSAIYYFNKWGWFFDKERKSINNDTLQKLDYKE